MTAYTSLPQEALPYSNDPVLDNVLATVSAGADPPTVEAALHEMFNHKYDIWTRLADVELKQIRLFARDRYVGLSTGP